MVKILLLDCAESLRVNLESQGFKVEAGTIGYCTGERRLSSQVYEHDVLIYNPQALRGEGRYIKDASPQYSLGDLEKHLTSGATILVFVNQLSADENVQNAIYAWIPFMPRMRPTSDRVVWANPLTEYPESDFRYLASIVTTDGLATPVLQKIYPPEKARFETDIIRLFGNRLGDCLGVFIRRGRGGLILLPRFESNDDVIETFLTRVIPSIYSSNVRQGLADLFKSPAESDAENRLGDLNAQATTLREKQTATRVELTKMTRFKIKTIENDPTAKQIAVYYDHALRQDDAALYYLYKIIEAVENKFGSETVAIASVGEKVAWKAVKRLANESYKDARHAPKAGDVIKKWTPAELKQGFIDTRKVIFAYFLTLFPSPPGGTVSGP